MRKKLTPACIEVGMQLPWDLSNNSGRTLFRKGFSVHNDAALERLMKLELYYTPDDPSAAAAATDQREETPPHVAPAAGSPFAELDRLSERLEQVFDSIVREPAHCRERLQSLAGDTRELYLHHPSACIAAIHFRHERPIASLHPLYSIFLTELLAAPLGYSEDTRLAAAAAALTANIGKYEHHHEWSALNEPLNEDQQALLREHPLKSAELLRACGVDDDLWLTVVEQHHERRDGSGYPRAISGDRLLPQSLVLHLIDRYLSFVMPRGQRRIEHPTEALRIIYEDAAAHGQELVSTLIKQIGVYPPGTPVKLANGEIAVVTRNEVSHARFPHVVSVAKGDDDYLKEPIARDTHDEQFKVQGLHHFDPGSGDKHPATRVANWS